MEPVAERPVEHHATNSQIEDAAIKFVIEQEAKDGRVAQDSRHQGAVADLISGDRIIEVKAAGGSSRGYEAWLEPKQYDAAMSDPNFWLYLVENVKQGNPARFRLLRFGGEPLRQLLEGAKPRKYYTVPIPVAVYDQALLES